MDNQSPQLDYIQIQGLDPQPREKKIGAFFTSWDNDKVLPAFRKALSEISPAKKDATNPHFKSKYADFASCMDAVKPALDANGLALSQPPTLAADLKSALVNRVIFHDSGQYIRWELNMPFEFAVKPHEVGKSITYARRYALAGVGIITDEDDDGNNGSGLDNRSAPTRQQPPPPPPAKQTRQAAPKPEPQPTTQQQTQPSQPKAQASAEGTSLSDMFIKISEAHPGATEPAVRKFLASCRIDKESEDLQVRFLKLYITNRDYAKFGQRWKDTGKTFEECVKEAEANGIEKLEWCQIKAA